MRPWIGLSVSLIPLLALAGPGWKLHFLQELSQRPSESDQQFLARTATYLRDYTAMTGYEACGTFCAGPAGQSIVLFTGKSQITCPLVASCGGKGVKALPLVIHSHPLEGRLKLNEVDAEMINTKRWLFKKKPGAWMSLDPRRFSKEDYELGPGYLVHGDKVWHQAGHGTERLIFTLPPAALNRPPTPRADGLEN